MKITLVCTLVFAFFVGLSNQQCLTKNDDRRLNPNPNPQQMLYHGQQGFSLDLLRAFNLLNSDGNIFFSPYSTFQALLLVYFIAANETEEVLKKTLRLDTLQDKAGIFSAYKFDKLATVVQGSNSSYEFITTDRIVVAQQLRLRECVTTLFSNEFEKENFQAGPDIARIRINNWVELTTHGNIKNLLAPGTIDAQTNLVLVNAAYFKGKWEKKFDPRLTRREVFYISPSKRAVADMMYTEAIFNYDVSETLMAHVLELPYEGDDISMYILLPPFSKEDGIETVLTRLTLENFVNMVNGSLSPRQVQVSLPKFSVEHTIELVPILEYLGVGNLFRQDADFSVLTADRDASFGASIHRARIEVTEEGAQAADATPKFSWRILSDENEQPVEFKCNHQFIYLVYNKKMHTVFFAGIYRRPA